MRVLPPRGVLAGLGAAQQQLAPRMGAMIYPASRPSLPPPSLPPSQNTTAARWGAQDELPWWVLLHVPPPGFGRALNCIKAMQIWCTWRVRWR